MAEVRQCASFLSLSLHDWIFQAHHARSQNLDDFLAGWLSGVAGLALTQPVDFILTRLQSSGCAKSAAGANEGLISMFRGAMPLFATVPLNNAMLMYGYGVGKSFGEAKGGSTLLPVFIGGCAGGFVQSFLQSPVELVKVRLQLAAVGQSPSTGALTMQLLRDGLGSKGLHATLLRDVVPHGVWFSAYEWSKQTLERRAAAAQIVSTAEPPPLSAAAQLSAGAFAATAAWVVGYPADVIKTRCQMEGGHGTVTEAVRAIHAEGGYRAFYNGLGLKLLRAVPQSAAGFFVYEYAMKVLALRHDRA